jgi:hypothetical protein
MYIARGLTDRAAAVAPHGAGSTPTSYADDLRQLQRLIARATATGRLDRQDEAAITTVLAQTPPYSVEKCELFRQLQERVWQAELHLDW